MKTIVSTNQSFQYLYSITLDSKIETIEKLRTAKAILNKAFTVVNAYELAKAEPVDRLKALDHQIQLYFNAGKQEEKKDEIEKLKAKRTEILDSEIKPISNTEVELELEDNEVAFLMNEMSEVLAETKKMNTAEEMEMFDILFTALESAK